jgi:hypothetical protein
VALSRSRVVAATVLAAALALWVGSNVVRASEVNGLAAVSTFTVVDGAVLMSHSGAEFTSARVGDVVAAGDTIRTGAGASAEITYFDGSSVRLEADADVVVTSLRSSDGGAPQTFARVWHVISELVSGSARYKVGGPSWTASVRG